MENTETNTPQVGTPDTEPKTGAATGTNTSDTSQPLEDKVCDVSPVKFFFYATLVGGGLNLLTWFISMSGIYQWNMLFPVFLGVNIVALFIIFGFYNLTSFVRPKKVGNILATLVFATHVVGVPLAIAHLFIPPAMSSCAAQNNMSLAWRDDECVYHYNGTMIDNKYDLLETKNKVTRDGDKTYSDTVYVVRDLNDRTGEITTRDGIVTDTTFDDKSVIGKPASNVKHSVKSGDKETVEVRVNRDLTAPLDGARNPMDGFCFDGNLYKKEEKAIDPEMYQANMYNVGTCTQDDNYAMMKAN
jgi:hypothetical protein